MASLQEILNSEAGDIARQLDADDGSYDGNIDIEILNKFLSENGFRTYNCQAESDSVPFIDVVKMIYNLKREQAATGATTIKVDFDPAEEMRKAKKAYERWR